MHMLRVQKTNVPLMLTLCVAILTLGCSDSNPIGNFSDPQVVTPVEYPFIFEGVFSEYDPARKRSTQLLDLNGLPFALMDTDKSTSTSLQTGINSTTNEPEISEFLSRNPLPNFIAYAENDVLWLYELQYRHLHKIYDFNASENISGRENICNIQERTIAEPSSLEQGVINYVEDLVVYVEAVTDGGDCSDLNQLSYYAMNIVADPDIRFRVRQPVKDDLQQLSDITYTGLYGEKTLSTESLMYSGIPVVDIPNKLNLHIGISRINNTLNAYVTNDAGTETSLLWTLQGTNFSDIAEQRIQAWSTEKLNTLDSRVHRGLRYLKTHDRYIFSHNDELFALDHATLFDDDSQLVRLNALNTPFSSLDPSPNINRLYSRFYQATENGDASFISNDQIRTITDSAQNIETIDINSTESGVEQKTTLRGEIGNLILKDYLDGDASLVTVDISNIETTIFNKSDSTFWGFGNVPGAPTSIAFQNTTTGSWDSVFYTSLVPTLPSTQDTENTIPVRFYDYRFYPNHDEDREQGLSLAFFRSLDVYGSSSAVLAPSSLYRFDSDIDATGFRGEKITDFPYDLLPGAINAVYVYNDDFGYAELNHPDGWRHYFFNPTNKASENEVVDDGGQGSENSQGSENAEDGMGIPNFEDNGGSDLELIPLP